MEFFNNKTNGLKLLEIKRIIETIFMEKTKLRRRILFCAKSEQYLSEK